MKKKKRFIVLAALLLLFTLCSIGYVSFNGNTCTVDMINTQIPNLPKEDVSVKIEDPSIVEVTDIQVITSTDGINSENMQSASVTFHGLKSGETKATVYSLYHDENTLVAMTPELKLQVMPWGTVVEMNYLTFNGWKQIEYGILISVGLVAVVCFATFVEFFVTAQFSYAMVACGGVAGYCTFMLLLTMYDMQYFNTFHSFLYSLSDTGFWFVLLTSPVMLVLCFAIAFSNIWLLRHEGFRPQNMLGIGLAVIWVLGIGVMTDINSLLFDMSFIDLTFLSPAFVLAGLRHQLFRMYAALDHHLRVLLYEIQAALQQGLPDHPRLRHPQGRHADADFTRQGGRRHPL